MFANFNFIKTKEGQEFAGCTYLIERFDKSPLYCDDLANCTSIFSEFIDNFKIYLWNTYDSSGFY